ncbi:MAG: hypothetical protein ABIR16_07025 [Dokdonella sp.]
MLILEGTLETSGELHRWRVMRLADRYVCARDEAVLDTNDRNEAADFLANDGNARHLAQAHRFLDSMMDGGNLATHTIARPPGPISD